MNLKENKVKCDNLFRDVINPTLEIVKIEIEKYDREISLRLAKPASLETTQDGFRYHYLSTISVDYNGGSEYYFNAVCQLDSKTPESIYLHFEGFHKTNKNLNIEDITEESIIKYILETYE